MFFTSSGEKNKTVNVSYVCSVHMGKLSDFLTTSCITQLDFLRDQDDPTMSKCCGGGDDGDDEGLKMVCFCSHYREVSVLRKIVWTCLFLELQKLCLCMFLWYLSSKNCLYIFLCFDFCSSVCCLYLYINCRETCLHISVYCFILFFRSIGLLSPIPPPPSPLPPPLPPTQPSSPFSGCFSPLLLILLFSKHLFVSP